MNDRQDPYDPYATHEQQLIGYDAYGRPVYGQVPAQPAQYEQAYEQQYGYDQGYGQQAYYPQQQQPQQQPAAPDYGQQEYPRTPGYGYDTQHTQQSQQW
ncbi:hypothetical protein VR46_01930, partial [Streptomyces sp. NRRL S-444]